MSWHHQLCHLPYCIFFCFTSSVFLTKWLIESRNKPPLCVACQFSQSYCRPWQTKGNKIGSICTPSQKESGNGILVDQIVSAQPGLIPQMSDFLTNKWLWCCTTFVNHVSDYVYVHLTRDLSLSEMLHDKATIENIMTQAGKTINHYHADNGRFS